MGRIRNVGKMGRWVWLFVTGCLLAAAESAHLVELKKRDISSTEQHHILELLQLEAGNGNNEVPNIALNSNFFGTIEIGDDKQQFEVVFDTGSDALWVYSDSCRLCKEINKHVFRRTSSKTYHQKQSPFSIKYGTGESHGTTGSDVMRLGDLEVVSQDFGQCDQPDNVMRGFPFDGIVGLSRPMFHDPNGLAPFMTTVKTEHVLEHKRLANTFAFYLGRDEGDRSYLIFGGSHNMLHEGAVHWVPALSRNIFWELPLDDILIHDKKANVSAVSAHETSPPISLERHLQDSAMHDNYVTAMASNHVMTHPRTRAPAPVSHVLNHKSHNNHHHNTKHNNNNKHNEHMPLLFAQSELAGQSADGYNFVTTAEQVLLQLQSRVGGSHGHKTTKHNHPKHAVHHVSTDLEAQGGDATTHSRDLAPLTPTIHTLPKRQSPAGAAHTTTTTTGNRTFTTTDRASSASKPHVVDVVGGGELLADVAVSPGVSITPCTQDASHPCVLSMDSGHSLISGPPELVRELKARTSPAVAGPCSDEVTAALPDVSFVIGGKLFTLTPQDYLIELEGKCTPAFRERPFRNGHDWVLGEHFMRTFYSVFDYDDMRVGLARLDTIKQHLPTILTRTDPKQP